MATNRPRRSNRRPRYLGIDVSGEFYLSHFVPALEAWTQTRPKAEVTQSLIEIGYSMGMVQNQSDLDTCPHLNSRGMFLTTPNTIGGNFRTTNTPIHLTTTTPKPPTANPHN